jgi:hypothetical protein
MVMMANIAATHTAEKAFSHIRRNAVQRIGFLMVDPLDVVAATQVVPGLRFAEPQSSSR